MFKEFGTPHKRKSAALGSGFIIDKKGTVITNNHVIQNAEDIVVKVDGDKEFKAKMELMTSEDQLDLDQKIIKYNKTSPVFFFPYSNMFSHC